MLIFLYLDMELSNLFYTFLLSVFVLLFTLFNTTHFSTTKSDAAISIVADSENENDEHEWEFEWLLFIAPTKKQVYVSSSPIETTALKRMHYKSLAPIDPPPEV